MPYTSQADLEERYGAALLVDLTDRADVATGTIDVATVARAISETDALIDGYLRSRYVLPLSVVPPIIGTLARQIAIYILHPYEPNEKIRRDHDAAIAQLREIARGLIQLDADGVAPDQSGAGGARLTDRERDMTAGTLKGLI